jgi:ABC-2 type transport system permease protein
MRKLMIMGVGIQEVSKELFILLGFTVILLGLALAKFKQRLE